jgi:hypothetical protein
MNIDCLMSRPFAETHSLRRKGIPDLSQSNPYVVGVAPFVMKAEISPSLAELDNRFT